MSAPRVTIGVPVYNGARFLGQALDALSAQDFDSMEIVVSDNASTDETADIISDARSRDPRIRHILQPVNRGGVWNVNHLIDEAQGELFKWAYYDDICAPTFVSSCVSALDDSGPAAVLACPRTVTIDADGVTIEERQDTDLGLDEPTPHQRVLHLLRSLANQTEFGVMRTDVVRATRRVQPYIGSEMFFLTEMIIRGAFLTVPEQLLALRRHPEQYGRDRFTEANWYVGSGQKQSLLPFAKMNALLMRSVVTSGQSAAEQARMVGSVLRGWTLPRWRSMASDVKNLPKTWRLRRQQQA